jgi:hypothetical protein
VLFYGTLVVISEIQQKYGKNDVSGTVYGQLCMRLLKELLRKLQTLFRYNTHDSFNPLGQKDNKTGQKYSKS